MSSAAATDCTIVGAGFAGLACAYALARNGLRVTVLEKKADAGAKLHTTGIIVKDAVDQITLLDGLPAHLARRVAGVRLYAPNLRHVDLSAPGYYFLAAGTPASCAGWRSKPSKLARTLPSSIRSPCELG